AVDCAQRAGAGGSHAGLWERLSSRAQALLPDLTAAELCRALFGFYRARHSDDGLLHGSCEAILTETPGTDLKPNDAALLLKALSKHRFVHLPATDFLLRRCAEELPSATAADISHLLSAVVRLGLRERLAERGPHPGLLGRLFAAARAQLADAYLPPADLTNLCAAAALLPAVEQSAALLAAAAGQLRGRADRAAAAPPRDVVRHRIFGSDPISVLAGSI
ncbi:unnamed protein product, partial [Prorocentrum cordatum]